MVEGMARRGQKVVVIGAGFGGLSSALALNAAGFDVTVYERHNAPGGKAAEVTVDGVGFDTGPSLLTMPEVLTRLEQVAHVDLWNRLELRTMSPAFEYIWPDGTRLDVHHALNDTLDSVRAAFSAEDADELDDFAEYARLIWETSAPHFVLGDAPSVRGLVTKDLMTLMSVGKIDAQRSMHSAITRRISNPFLRDILMRYATYNGSDVRKAPATLNCIAHVELGEGGYGVVGGMHAVAEALYRAAVEAGVNFHFERTVSGVECRSKRITGIRLADGKLAEADAVVCNADVAHLFRRLLPGCETRAAAVRADASMSGYTFVVNAAPNGDRRPHSVLFGTRYLSEFEAIFDRATVTAEPTIYACDQSKTHARAGWADGDPLFVMINTPPVDRMLNPPDWREVRDAACRRLADAGVCQPNPPVMWERTPTGLERQFPDSGGSIYGQSSNSVFAAFRRQSNKVPDFPGLYLASGGAHPGGGVPLCILSGLAAARQLVSDQASKSTWSKQMQRFAFGRR